MLGATVAETIDRFENSESTTRLNHPGAAATPGSGEESVAVAAVFRDESPPGAERFENGTAHVVVFESNQVLRVDEHGEVCPCGNNEKYTRRMGTPPKTAQKRRHQANCEHATLVSKCEEYGACPECGSWAIASKTYTGDIRQDAVVLQEDYCDECGEYLGC